MAREDDGRTNLWFSPWIQEHPVRAALSRFALLALAIGIGMLLRGSPAPPRSAAAKQYLRIETTVDAATLSFRGAFEQWTAGTPYPVMAGVSATLADAIDPGVRGLSTAHWPRLARPLVERLILALQALGNQARGTARTRPGDFGRWETSMFADLDAAEQASHQVRTALRLPDYTPDT